VNQDCLGGQTQAMSSIRERIGSTEKAVSARTLGAILQRAGVEVCTLSP
jgi:hypothetical protein